MTESERSGELARLWIESWNTMDMDWLRRQLAPDFVHTSPFGRLAGRDHYLATVEPMARKSVTDLRIVDVIASGDRSAIWFDNITPNGPVPSCDWLRIENDLIKEIQSFYDSSRIREVLSADEQESLG